MNKIEKENSITTAERMMELFPHLSSKDAKKLDLKIKARIAWDDREECILTYVWKVLTPIKKNKCCCHKTESIFSEMLVLQ